jgi:VirE N-terminal domain
LHHFFSPISIIKRVHMQAQVQKAESIKPVLQDSPLSIPVSLYRNCTSHEQATVNLLTLLTTDSYQPGIEALRAMAGAEQDAAKKQLPCYTIGGVFQGGHSAGNRTQASNLIGIDLDFKDNAHVQGFGNLKAACKQVPFILYCGLSCRGKGYLVIMALKYPDKFLQQFRASRVSLNDLD